LAVSTVGCHIAIDLALLGACFRFSGNVMAILRGDRIDPVRTPIVESLNQSNVVSLSIVATQNGEIVGAESVGWVDREARVRTTPNSVSPLASLSKSPTAAGVVVPVDRQFVDLD